MLGRNLNHLIGVMSFPLNTFGPATIVDVDPPSHICGTGALAPRVLGRAELRQAIDATAGITPRITGEGAINSCDCD